MNDDCVKCDCGCHCGTTCIWCGCVGCEHEETNS
jgi:hypothetical protein